MCCTRLAGNAGCKNDAKKLPYAHHRTTLSGYIFATKPRVDNRKKNLLSSNISPTCPYNMVDFGPLAAEIISLVWRTPANFNGVRVLAALLHSQTRWTEGANCIRQGGHHVGHLPTFLVLVCIIFIFIALYTYVQMWYVLNSYLLTYLLTQSYISLSRLCRLHPTGPYTKIS